MSIVEMAVIVLAIIVGIQAICISLFNKKLHRMEEILGDLRIDITAYEKLKAQAVKSRPVNKNKVGNWKK